MKQILFLISSALLFSAALSLNGSVKDLDGNEYATTTIGSQEWMAENLRVTKFNNGDDIPFAATVEEWEEACSNKEPMAVYYDFDENNGTEHGVLYNIFAVNDERGIAPEGWKVADYTDWQTLLAPYKPTSDSKRGFKNSKPLKSTTGWSAKKGSNDTGFNAKPSGGTTWGDGKLFNGKGELIRLWGGETLQYWDNAPTGEYTYIEMGDWYNGVNLFTANKETNIVGAYVRCIKK